MAERPESPRRRAYGAVRLEPGVEAAESPSFETAWDSNPGVRQRTTVAKPAVSLPLWLVDLAGFLYAVSMHKYAVRDALASSTGIQGVLEIGCITGAFFCVFLVARKQRRQYPPFLTTILLATFGLLALCSSWRSFAPAASVAKGLLFLCVLTTCYLAVQCGLMRRYLRAVYRSYVLLLLTGLAAGILLPHTYPLFTVDAYSGRTTMSVFDTFFGVVGEDAALMFLLAPLIFEKPNLWAQTFLFGMNIMAGGKASSALLCVLAFAGYLAGTRRWRSWRSVSLVAGAGVVFAGAIFLLLSSHSAALFAKPAQALYGNQVSTNAKGFDGREQLWVDAIGLLPNVPLLGYGFEGDRALMIEVASWSGSSHSSYLEAALSGGLAAFALLVLALGLIASSCFRTVGRLRFRLLLVLGFILMDGIVGIIFSDPSFLGLMILAWLPYRAQAPLHPAASLMSTQRRTSKLPSPPASMAPC